MQTRGFWLLAISPLVMLAVGCGSRIKDDGGQGPIDGSLYREALLDNQQRLAGEDHPVTRGTVDSTLGGISESYDKVIDQPFTHLWEMITGDNAAKAVREALDPQNADNRRAGTLRMTDWSFERTGKDDWKVYASIVRDPDYTVRAAAIRALNRCRAVGYTDVFLERLDASKEETLVRVEAAKALANIPDPTAVPSLLEHLRADDSPDVRIACADALRNFKTTEVLSGLVKTLHDRDFSISWQSRQSLALITGQDFRYDAKAWLDYVSNRK